jgi:hypothetical protein
MRWRLRDARAVAVVLAAGAARAVLGTAALRDPDLLASLATEHGDRIVAAADARSGKVAVEGWEQETATAVEELVRQLARRGVRRFVYTPVEVDGTLGGNLEGRARRRRCRPERCRVALLGRRGSLSTCAPSRRWSPAPAAWSSAVRSTTGDSRSPRVRRA